MMPITTTMSITPTMVHLLRKHCCCCIAMILYQLYLQQILHLQECRSVKDMRLSTRKDGCSVVQAVTSNEHYKPALVHPSTTSIPAMNGVGHLHLDQPRHETVG